MFLGVFWSTDSKFDEKKVKNFLARAHFGFFYIFFALIFFGKNSAQKLSTYSERAGQTASVTGKILGVTRCALFLLTKMYPQNLNIRDFKITFVT